MELRHLRHFVVVAEELNFRRAAERIHIDQTPLSRTIRDLENQLGVTLLVRSPRKMRLTPAGTKLLDETRRLFIRLERIRRLVQETDARFRAPMRVGVADGIAQPKLSECFAGWRRVAPNVPVEVIEMRAGELRHALGREEVDVGFSFGLPNDDVIVQEPAWAYPLTALLPLGHELATDTVLPISELLAFPMVEWHLDRLPGLRQQMDAVGRLHAMKPASAGEARTLAGYVTRVAAGMGVGVADAGHMATLHRPDVAVVPLAEDIRMTTYVLYKRHGPGEQTTVQRFLTHVKTLT